MSSIRIYVEMFSEMISDADVLNILCYIKDVALLKEIEEKSGIRLSVVHDWLHGKADPIPKDKKKRFLEALLDVAGVEGLKYLARSKRVAYVRLLGALLENGVDISELQVVVRGNIITNKK